MSSLKHSALFAPSRFASRLPAPRLLAVALSALLATVACSPSQPTSSSAPVTPAADAATAATTHNAATDANVDEALPAAWLAVTGTDVPSVPASQQDLPATVRSDDDVEVTIEDTRRTIAGSDDIIAVMESLGLADHVFAAPRNSVTAAGRAAKQQFLFNRNTGVEGVLSLDGTLFVGNSLRRHAQSGLAQKLRDADLDAVIVDDLQPAPDKVRKIAAIFGHADEGITLATQVQAQLDHAAQIAASHPRKPRVIHLSATGAGGMPTVGGADTAAAGVIRVAGGINIGDEAKVSNYSQLSNEGIVAAEPEIILLTRNDLRLLGGEAGLWKAYPSLKETPAGQANRVWVMPDIQLKATSVASGAGAIALAEALAAFAKQSGT